MLGDSIHSGKADQTQSSESAQTFSVAEFADKLQGLEAQFADLREQLRVMQKYAAVGTMTAIVAHEMNNLLTPLLGYSQYAITKDDSELWRKALERNVRSGEQLRRLCHNILSNSGNSERQIETIQVRPLVEELLDTSGRDWAKDKIVTTIDIDSNVTVRGDVGHLQQVLLNLLINARHALKPNGGILTITAERANDQIIISVTDNGPGVAAEDLPRIFEPFFSTKETQDSNVKTGSAGLGLHISQTLMEDMNGSLTVKSVPGNGATFLVSLPEADSPNA